MHTFDKGSDLAAVVAELEHRGLTRQEQARAVGMPYSTYMRKLNREGLTVSSSPDGWIPWKVSTEHNHHDPISRRLRWLAQAARGADTKYRGHRSAAIRWARELVEARKDVTYSRRRGFVVIPARPTEDDSWYLKHLLTAAERHVTNMPQLDDLEEGAN